MGDEPISVKPTSAEQAVFAEALQRDTPEARADYLEVACGTDTALRHRVEALLRAAESAGDFLEQPPTGLSGEADATLLASVFCEKPGDRIGRYRLLERIGEGGCGVVYMAEQEEPVRRRVALKIIKLGMDTRLVVARFEAERQALALMDHPNIAKVLDGGATQTGRLYFVMELVRGVRITEFCDEARLTTEARLRLFVQVCQALQHAHQKGIIHRDIKPSNVLVTVNDGAAVPKVIDFGIAKAIAQKLTDKTLFTEFQALVGTPAYMSPEQAEMSSVDIDTRSDIYGLGVLLYELLTGHPPFDGEQLLSAGLDEMRRIIRDEQPPKPSTRLTNLVAASKSETDGASSRRLLPTKELISAVRGDLDWIVMKCLEKDRTRRYQTANGIAADIQRHLNHEPVTARSPSGLYLLQKLAQRKRGALITAITVLVALLVALLTLATSNARIRQERNQKGRALLERSAALEAARASEQRAREQLLVSLQNQAQARRNSRQMGQRLESLAALAEAARIRPASELRDNAIAAMAVPDAARGPVWQGWNPDTKAFTYESLHQRCARFGQDGTISIRTIPDDRELQRLESGSEPKAGRAFTFSPDGRFIAWLDESGRLRIWQWERGDSVLKSAPSACSALAFSPDSRRVAVGHEAWITCFDLSTGEASRRWQTRGRAYSMNFHPDSRRLAVGYDHANVVSIYRADDGEHVADLPRGDSSMTIVTWHPDGNLLATGGSDPRIQIWDVPTQGKLAVLEGHVEHVTALMFHWSGDLLLSASWDGSVRLWQPLPGRMLMRFPSAGWLGFSREDGRWTGVISPSDLQAQLWGLVPSQEYHTFLNTFREGENMPREGEINPDGTLLALGGTDGVRLWDVARGREVAWLRLGDTTSVLLRDEGRELLTCGSADGLQRWPIEANADASGGWRLGPSHQIALPFTPTRMAKGRDDRTLAVVGESAGQCVVLDLVTESVRVAELPHLHAGFIALSPDAGRVASSGWHSDRVKVWDGESGKLLKELETRAPSLVFLTPDNRELIVARDKEFIFYDLNSLEVSRRMPREVGLYPGHVAFTADGKLMALELAPGLIHLKEITSGRTVAKLEDPQGDHSTWMSFTPDGTQLVVAARYAGSIHRWDLRAIRARLKTMNLDWDWPEFSAPPPVETSFSKNRPPLRVQVVGTNPIAVTPAAATNASPAKP
ncbi:MAG: protein kinase [Verrucomicrobia bacterium]|nr:protein kinase [Verrucomicrobiota bacterium]